MRFRQRFLRAYTEADWFAHLLLATCIAAAFNFLDILSQEMAAAQAAGTRIVDGFEITICYFGPGPSFQPRLFVLIALLIATPGAFMRTTLSRFISTVGSAAALAVYIRWWITSPHEVKHFAYLPYGTPIDVGIALSIAVCLVLLLDRLFDGEKSIVWSNRPFQ